MTQQVVNEVVTETEQLLADRFGRKRAFLLGRGATGLALLYETLTPPGGRVLLPAIACPSVLATCLLVNRTPVVVDIRENLSIDIGEVEKIARQGDLVLAIHLYGIPCHIRELDLICSAKGAVLVEDAAQAVGGSLDGRALGSFGRASILSFAAGKILPADGGGAILTDDDELIEKLEIPVAELPARPQNINGKARALRDELTRVFNRARRDDPEAASEWAWLYNAFGDVYRFALEPGQAVGIPPALDDLERNVESRREKVGWFLELLEGMNLERIEYPADSAPFRFTFLLPRLSGSEVQDCTEEIRSAGLHASNLYLPLHWLAPERIETDGCPRADSAGVRMINLWVDDATTRDEAVRASRILSKWA